MAKKLFALVVGGGCLLGLVLVPYLSSAAKAKAPAKVKDDGRAACYECHGEIKDLKEKSKHATLACSTCHAGLKEHLADYEKRPVTLIDAKVCGKCHVDEYRSSMEVNYEAQAAIELEAVLDPAEQGAYPFRLENGEIRLEQAVRELVADLRAGTPAGILSARFHNGIASLSAQACARLSRETGLGEVALSGGVWQNVTLLSKTIRLLQDDHFTTYIHRQVPTNDGGLALGQAVVAAHTLGD